jgi:hypothetical protein
MGGRAVTCLDAQKLMPKMVITIAIIVAALASAAQARPNARRAARTIAAQLRGFPHRHAVQRISDAREAEERQLPCKGCWFVAFRDTWSTHRGGSSHTNTYVGVLGRRGWKLVDPCIPTRAIQAALRVSRLCAAERRRIVREREAQRRRAERYRRGPREQERPRPAVVDESRAQEECSAFGSWILGASAHWVTGTEARGSEADPVIQCEVVPGSASERESQGEEAGTKLWISFSQMHEVEEQGVPLSEAQALAA